VRVCLLGLHAIDQQPKDNALQSAYTTKLFESFGAKSLASRGRVCLR
jgi:hypothetical protein